MRIEPLAAALGAEIFEADLCRLDDEGWRRLYQAFLDHSVLVIRDQDLSPADQVRVARHFGTPQEDPLKTGVDGEMTVTRIIKEADEAENFGHLWHMDMSFLATPPKASLLLARDVPPVGGDTLFAGLTMAYACLSEGMQTLLGELIVLHENWPNDLSRFKGIEVKPRPRQRRVAEHPLIARHPETERPRLCISPFYARQIKDMSLEESAPLLGFLNDWATRSEFICRVRWRPGTLTIWDNRAVIHDVPSDDFAARLGDQGFRREMHRVTVDG